MQKSIYKRCYLIFQEVQFIKNQIYKSLLQEPVIPGL